jgi:hypothetical protein
MGNFKGKGCFSRLPWPKQCDGGIAVDRRNKLFIYAALKVCAVRNHACNYGILCHICKVFRPHLAGFDVDSKLAMGGNRAKVLKCEFVNHGFGFDSSADRAVQSSGCRLRVPPDREQHFQQAHEQSPEMPSQYD